MVVCPLCDALLSESEDLQEHYRTRCKSSGLRGSAHLPTRKLGGKKQVNVIFRWLPYRTVTDTAVHLFGDKSLNQGNPLPMVPGSGGNFSSAQLAVSVGEYAACQLALEHGDMLIVQPFQVTERSSVVYIFPDAKPDLATSSLLLTGQQYLATASPSSLRHQSDESDLLASDSDDLSDSALAATGSTRAIAYSPPNARGYGQVAVREDGNQRLGAGGDRFSSRQRPDGAAVAGSAPDYSSSPAVASSLYRELLLHQIGKDDSLIKRQVVHESNRTHDRHDPAGSGGAAGDGGGASAVAGAERTRPGHAMRAQPGQLTAAHASSAAAAAPAQELFTPLGDSRPRSSSLGNRRRTGTPASAGLSEGDRTGGRTGGGTALPKVAAVQVSPSSSALPHGAADAAGAAAGSGSVASQARGMVPEGALAAAALPHGIPRGAAAAATAAATLPAGVGKQAFVINEIRILGDAPAVLRSPGHRPGSAPTSRRKPTVDDGDDNYLWRPSDFKSPATLMDRVPAVARNAEVPLSIGVFVSGAERSTVAASGVSTVAPGTIPFRPPASLSQAIMADSTAATLPTRAPPPGPAVSDAASLSASVTASSARSPRASRTPSGSAAADAVAATLPSPARVTALAAVQSPATQCAGDVMPRSVLEAQRDSTSSGSDGSSDEASDETCSASGSSDSEIEDEARDGQAGQEVTSDFSASSLSDISGIGENVDGTMNPNSSAAGLSAGHATHWSRDAPGIADHGSTPQSSLNEIEAIATPLGTLPDEREADVLSVPTSAGTLELQQRCELLEQNMVRQRAHLESQLRRRDDDIQRLQEQVQQSQHEVNRHADVLSSLQRLETALSAGEEEKSCLRAELETMGRQTAVLESALTTHKETEQLQAMQLEEIRSELEKSNKTVEAALRLQQAFDQQREELRLANADRDVLMQQNREIIASNRKQHVEAEALNKKVDELQQENAQLSQANVARERSLEKEILALRAQREQSVAEVDEYQAEIGQIRDELGKYQEAYQGREALFLQKLAEAQQQLQTALHEVAQRDAFIAEQSRQIVPAAGQSVADECIQLRASNTALQAEVTRVELERDDEVARLRKDIADLLRHGRESAVDLDAAAGQGLGGGNRADELQERCAFLVGQVQSLEDVVRKTSHEKANMRKLAERYRNERNACRLEVAELRSQLQMSPPHAGVPSQHARVPSQHAGVPSQHAGVPSQHAKATSPALASSGQYLSPEQLDLQRRHPATREQQWLPAASSATTASLKPYPVRSTASGRSPTKPSPGPMTATRPASDFISADSQVPLTFEHAATRPPPPAAVAVPSLANGNVRSASSKSRSRSVTRSRSMPHPVEGAKSAESQQHRSARHTRSASAVRAARPPGRLPGTILGPALHADCTPPADFLPARVSVNDPVLVRRTNDERHLGFVRYIGPLHGAAGEYYGVELVAELGKNDGSHRGHAYFTCASKRGIFVPRHRIEPLGSQHYPA